MNVLFLTNAHTESGVGHHADELHRALEAVAAPGQPELTYALLDGVKRSLILNGRTMRQLPAWPGPLGVKTVSWLRLGRQLRSAVYGLTYDLWHATNQTLSFIPPRAKPSVVTVHDLIELLEPQQRSSRLAAQYLYHGITRATQVIAVSHYTAQTVQKYYGLPAEKITVIHNSVSRSFHPIENFSQTIGYHTLQRELNLENRYQIILYVGSEHPRKNIAVALRAFAQLRKKNPEALFIKIGEPGLASGRLELLEIIGRLHLQHAVRLIRYASAERLNELFNRATALIFPSRFEGFGLPPLEAMAAGLPVVCSNATSLPEVVGEAALTRYPDDVDGFAQDLERVITDQALRQRLRDAGLTRAAQFTWTKAAAQTLDVYKKVLA